MDFIEKIVGFIYVTLNVLYFCVFCALASSFDKFLSIQYLSSYRQIDQVY